MGSKFLKTIHGIVLIPQMILSLICIFLSISPTTPPGTRSVNVTNIIAFQFAVSIHCFMSSFIHLGTSLLSKSTEKKLRFSYYYIYHSLITIFLCLLIGILVFVFEYDPSITATIAGVLTIVNGLCYFGGIISIHYEKISALLCKKKKKQGRAPPRKERRERRKRDRTPQRYKRKEDEIGQREEKRMKKETLPSTKERQLRETRKKGETSREKERKYEKDVVDKKIPKKAQTKKTDQDVMKREIKERRHPKPRK